MNKENILRVADAIEEGSLDLGFNMAYYEASARYAPDLSGRGCGTTACIGGWAAMLRDGNTYLASAVMVANWFDIDLVTAILLTQTHLEATQAQAVRTLRHLAETGFVNWDLEP